VLNVPVLGYVFGSKTKKKTDDQILVALIPHIVRAPDFSSMGEPGVYAGSDRVVRVQRKPDGSASTLAPTDGTRVSPDLGQTPAAPNTAAPGSASPQSQAPPAAAPAQPNPFISPQGYPRRVPGMQPPQGQPQGDQPTEPEPQPQAEPPQP